MLPEAGPGILSFEPMFYGRKVEGGWDEFWVNLVPVKGNGNRGMGATPHGVGSGDRLAKGVAKPVDKHPSPPLRFGHFYCHEFRRPLRHLFAHLAGELADLLLI